MVDEGVGHPRPLQRRPHTLPRRPTPVHDEDSDGTVPTRVVPSGSDGRGD
jgi:hypothetical protein